LLEVGGLDMKREFLELTALSNTQSASFQRAGVYATGISEKDKRAFVVQFRAKLRSLERVYKQSVSEEDHIRNIETFADKLSLEFPRVLAGGKMRTGVAQKAVNLYLKFLWCFGWIPEPPHCPIDSIVLAAVGDTDKWTKLDGIKEYRKKIAKIKQVAGDQSLAEWECTLWNSKAQSQGT
jgi:hypothetical protein